ncbi:hypothetical protein ACP70R_002746 [Stipagrostis hirtigluma subsp. patula]
MSSGDHGGGGDPAAKVFYRRRNATPAGAAQEGHSCSEPIHEDGRAPESAAQGHGNRRKKKRASKRSAAMSAKVAFLSRRTLNRDLPDQLEARAHRLLKDAGWSITPRVRNDRPKMAYYFAAPQKEVVATSLSQAWKFCGQRLCRVPGGSECGKCSKEWSDVDQFWKDFVDTMDDVGKVAADGENSLTLLRRWQLLDPFVAVVFIDKRITALQKQKTIRAVDSSTSVIDDGRNAAASDKPTPLSPRSGYSQVATDSCSDVQNSHHLSSTHVRPEIHGTQDGHTASHVKSNDETGQTSSGAKLNDGLVKRVRKKSRWLSDFESTGLNGLYARSFAQPTIGSNESESCSAGNSMSKKYMKAINKSAKMNGEKSDLSLPFSCERVNNSRGGGRTEGLMVPNECSGTTSAATESCLNKVVTAKKQKSRPLKKPSVRGFSEEEIAVSNGSNPVVESRHECNATMAKCNSCLESQSHERIATKRKSESWEKHPKEKPSEMNFNDDDLLITAIVKNRDISSCHKSASRQVSSKAKFMNLKNSKKGGRLLIQTAGKDGTNVLDGKRIILAKKTVLCWLIATGFVTLKDVVQCRNPKNNEVLKDGWVTWDGILCSCCIKTFSMSDFKAHADISLPKSSLNLCLQSGKSFTLCQLEAWSVEYTDRTSNACTRKVEAADENDDTCGFCGDGGELLCCDNCPSTYHQACLSTKELPDDNWYCHNCICQTCGCPISEKEISSFSAILKCLQCGSAHHDTCVEMEATTFEDMDSAEWFCGRYCKEIYLGFHGCVGIKNSLGDGLSWTILRCNSGGQQLRSVQKIAHVVECNTKLAVALTLMEECFVRMVDTRTGIDMIPHVLYNQGSKYARLNYQGFYTVILEKHEEILCAASIRVHGTKAAELPFIATCKEHRRQGMCRRLINTIEEMLRSFHVKMLVLSAIPELVSTWVSGFGFRPIEEHERKQLDTINLMLFPGASLLTKSLEYGIGTSEPGANNDRHDVLGLPDGNCILHRSGSEHLEQIASDLLELNKEELAVSLRKSKEECNSTVWNHSAKLTIGQV